MKKKHHELRDLPYLNDDQLENIKLLYGPDPSIPVYSDLVIPPTPQESSMKATQYLHKTKEKFFGSNRNSELLKNQALRNLKKTASGKSIDNPVSPQPNRLKPDAYFFTDPFHNIWQTSNTVTTIVQELRRLPYFLQGIQSDVEYRFREEVVAIVHKMDRKGLLKVKGKSKIQLNGSMTYFVTEVYQARRNIIVSLIKDHVIDPSLLTEKQINEFSESIPKQHALTDNISTRSYVSVTDNERHLSDFLGHINEIFPPCYRHDDEMDMTFSETRNTVISRLSESRDYDFSIPPPAATVPVSPRALNEPRNMIVSDFSLFIKPKPKFAQTAPVSPKKSLIVFADHSEKKQRLWDNDQNEKFWKLSDPLHNSRTKTEKHHIKILSSIVEEAQFPVPEFDPSSAIVPDLSFERKNSSKSILKENPSTFMKSNNYHLRNSIINTESGQCLINGNDYGTVDPEAMAFLKEISEADDGTTGIQTHNKLNQIWDQLGFTVMQKLSMVVKYSSDPDESSKLGDALCYWEQALDTVHNYDKEYKDLKNLLRFENGQEEHNITFFQNILKNTRTLEDSLTRINSILMANYGDELKIKQETVSDLIFKRRMKIQKIFDEQMIQITVDLS